MRKIVFLGGLAVGMAIGGLAIGAAAPVWAHDDASRVAALEARLAALEAKVGADPRNKHIVLSASEVLTARIGKRIDIDARDEIRLTSGRASLIMKKDGRIELKGSAITINGDAVVRGSGDTPVAGNKIGAN